MYRKIVWCYVLILTLLDISIKTKLTAQGKSHGVTVQDSLIEGITFQEWGKETGTEGENGGGGAVPEGALRLSPAALSFGHAALGVAHALTVTLTNTANVTMHLASVAGTTPDFHASFFDSKTLPPRGNTSFSVVYLGRREGPVTATLYIHTSLGVHKYSVSALGVASEWGVWPLVGVRVPSNATLEPVLTMHNPTDQTIQVREVYSSAAWLKLRLPGGGARAPPDLWALPPHGARPLVHLQLHHLHHYHQQPLTAYIRIKANTTGPPLVVVVEARAVPAGEYAPALHLRPGVRGSLDDPQQFTIEMGNSLEALVSLEASVWGAGCAATPLSPPPPPEPLANGVTDRTRTNGVCAGGGEGVRVSLDRATLQPQQAPTPVARLTLDYERLWAERRETEAWCAGWALVGRAALPYSLRLLAGTLRLIPNQLDFVTSSETAVREVVLRARNEFLVPILIVAVDHNSEIEKYFEPLEFTATELAPGTEAAVMRLRLRAAPPPHPLLAALTLRTNLTQYTLPLRVYDGKFELEWEWPNSTAGVVDLGATGTSSTRRVAVLIRNSAPVELCVLELGARVPGAAATLALLSPDQHCIASGDHAKAWLTVVASASAGTARGSAWVRSPHAVSEHAVALRAVTGALRARDLPLLHAAPYAWSPAPLTVESTMSLRMRLVDVTQDEPDPAFSFVIEESGEVERGVTVLGAVEYAPERACAPRCYSGLDPESVEGATWVRRAARVDEAALRTDEALLRERYALYAERAVTLTNISLFVHTTEVVRLPVRGTVRAHWPRLTDQGREREPTLAGVGGASALRVAARNPSRTHPLLLQPVLGRDLRLPPEAGGTESPICKSEECLWSTDAFKLAEWRATRGGARVAGDGVEASAGALPLLLLEPDAEVEIKIMFAPKEAAFLTTFLYLRNNLTILEGVQLVGRGAYPSFEIAGRRPGSNSPLLFEVSECAGGSGTVRRSLVARNTGRVPLRLREWRVAGAACQSRGFRITPCAPLALAPNQSRTIHITFTADFTVARVVAALHLRSELGLAEFALVGAAPARLLPACTTSAPRPPWEPALRTTGTLLAIAVAALILAAAAFDAERLLRRARASRPGPVRAPLDLRSMAHEPPPVAPRPPPPRRRRTARRPLPPLDPQAERRAFERWRAEVLRRDSERAEDDSSRSSEDADVTQPPDESGDAPEIIEAPDIEPSTDTPTPPDEYETEADTEEQPRTSGDEDNASTGTESSPHEEVEERDDDPDTRSATPAETYEVNRSVETDVHVDTVSNESGVRTSRPRREAGDTPRRNERPCAADGAEVANGRRPATKHNARKDKVPKRRERLAAPTARSSPARAVGGAVRWGASFSSVVAGSEPRLAPIGSDVPRREPPTRAAPPPDHSLFYYNDTAHAHVHTTSWCPPTSTPASAAVNATPAPDRLSFSASQREYVSEEQPTMRNGYGSIGSVWGGGVEERRQPAAAWLWGGYGTPPAIRPPPGFGPRAPLRTFDPFHSPLASIWAPAEHDWRRQDRDDN